MAETDDITFKTAMAFDYEIAQPMSPGIVRVVARNPSPFTFNGTNTYLVGTSALAVVDPGPGDGAHLAAILKAAAGRPITHVLITHAHRDHIDGADALKAATGATTCAALRGPPRYPAGDASPSGKDFVNMSFVPDRLLDDGDVIAGEDWELSAIHTPGHAPDHMCFALAGHRALFSGDHVMAWNTTVVAPPEGHMADYMTSLERLLDRSDRLFLPGHGGRIEDPMRTVKAYLIHRRWREQAVLDAIKRGETTVRKLVPAVYPGIEPDLSLAAAFSVLAHVEHLVERGLVACDGAPAWDRPLVPA